MAHFVTLCLFLDRSRTEKREELASYSAAHGQNWCANTALADAAAAADTLQCVRA